MSGALLHITVCAGCALGRSGFDSDLIAALQRAGIAARVGNTECMSGCARPSAVAFRTAGKTAYLFGDIIPSDLDDLVTFARLYSHSSDGQFSDARALGSLRTKALARIPAQNTASSLDL